MNGTGIQVSETCGRPDLSSCRPATNVPRTSVWVPIVSGDVSCSARLAERNKWPPVTDPLVVPRIRGVRGLRPRSRRSSWSSSGGPGRRALGRRRRSRRPRPRRSVVRDRVGPSRCGSGAASPTPSGTSPAPGRVAARGRRCRASGSSAATRPRTTPSAASLCGGRSCPRSPTTVGHTPRTRGAPTPAASRPARSTSGTPTHPASAASPGSRGTPHRLRTTPRGPRRSPGSPSPRPATPSGHAA